MDHYHEEDETLDVLKRYQEMLIRRSNKFFDLSEYECIIDFFIEQFNFKDAIGAVNLAIKQHPYAFSMKLKYIQLLIETGKPARALGIIKGMGDCETANYELFLAKGIALNLTGKYGEARTVFERALKLCDESKDELAYSIAQSYMQVGMPAQAIRYLMHAFKHNEDNILVLYDLALNYEKLDCPEKSILYYKKYLDLDPFAEHVWNNLGLLYTSINDVESASESFDLAIAINPDYYPAYFNKADLLELSNDINGAIGVYNEILSQDPSSTKALCSLGNCYGETGNLQEAIRFYQTALDISKDCSNALYGMGMIYMQQKKYRTSISVLKKAIGLQPENSDYWFMIGEAYSRLSKIDQAIHAYSMACDLNPLDFEACLAFAQAKFRKKQYEAALQILIQLYAIDCDNPTVNYRLAAYYTYLGKTDQALLYFEKGLSLNFDEHKDIFREFPRTRACSEIKRLVRHHVGRNQYLS